MNKILTESNITNFIISFLASFVGIVIALIIERRRMPKIIIKIEERANVDITYGSNKYVPGRAKHYRIIIQNKKLPYIIRWVIRQTAVNCSATVYFKGLNNTTNLSFQGRWPSTPQLTMYSDKMPKIISPDTVTIMAGDEEMLDIISKFESDKEAYGWNNESYMHEWRVPRYKLECGRYEIKVTINTQNGISKVKKFNLIVGETIEKTNLSSK